MSAMLSISLSIRHLLKTRIPFQPPKPLQRKGPSAQSNPSKQNASSPLRDEARPRGTTLLGATPLETPACDPLLGDTLVVPSAVKCSHKRNPGRETKKPVPPRDGFYYPRYHPTWRRRPLFSGTNIPAPVVTGGEPGQVYSPAISVAGSGGMFNWFVRARLAPTPGSLGVRPNLLVSVDAVGDIIRQGEGDVKLPSRCAVQDRTPCSPGPHAMQSRTARHVVSDTWSCGQ